MRSPFPFSSGLWGWRFNSGPGILQWVIGISSLSAGGMWYSRWWLLLSHSRIHLGSFLCVCPHSSTPSSFFFRLQLQVTSRFAICRDFQYVWHYFCVLLVTPKCSLVQLQVCISLIDRGWVVYSCVVSSAGLSPPLTIPCPYSSVLHPASPLKAPGIQVCISLHYNIVWES